MTAVLHDSGIITLSGACPVDDAETLLQLLLANPTAEIDWRDCTAAHAAVIQVLLVAKRPLRGPPAGPLLTRIVTPTISSSG
ncbi:hypothetical protein SSBR45G_15830 [Bradyrhizobium sp. SSBR45G]|uniref:hypothetical protein n=1 Tax=unclassified Bradyrhizobium TaxID=2631580 RepID=UPI002342941B|nr:MULTISPECIES: hypothetical protein [unclassified Bradyrhizobium]GLH76675.1 hypothetical protein SSBR45G_15830 [Bradyrhizobium sp. SSBR45G]GLH84288.1 hypothetical protein SSBR45R_17480 [Bradyrhizobium sp. SSBR45R]